MIVEPEAKEWSNEENVDAAKKLKEQGNKYFVAKEYKQALRAYHKAFLHLGGIVDKGSAMSAYSNKVASAELTQLANQLKFSISLNMAQIYIYQLKYDRGLDILAKASKIKTNAKLFYRRGICLMRLSQFQRAKQDFSKVVDLDPSMKSEVQKLMDELRSLQKRQNEKSKDMFKKFFK